GQSASARPSRPRACRTQADTKRVRSRSASSCPCSCRPPFRIPRAPLEHLCARSREQSSCHEPTRIRFPWFWVIAQPDHVARRWPIARIVGRKVAKALQRPREEAARSDPVSRLADERLRVLSRHALEGSTRGGETEHRMYSLDAWRETPYYSERERAALAWAEAVTR